jgi:FdrA protein
VSGLYTRSLVKRSAYQDSVSLLLLARALRGAAGVQEAAALMATPANRELLEHSGLLTPEAQAAGPTDLVIAVRADSAEAAAAALEKAEALLHAKQARLATGGRRAPRTLERAARELPGANLALISVPGAFAAMEARKALGLGLHVMLFSDNVPLEEEIRLKRLAVERGLLVMGPDCGSAILNGAPLGFANAVPRGRIGLVAASGTGLQAVTSLLALRGEGVSQAIGVGGRDMTEAVGGLMTLQALEALEADPATELMVLLGKPPAPAVRERVEARLRSGAKPCVIALLGEAVSTKPDGTIRRVPTLEDAAEAALGLLQGRDWSPRAFSDPERVRRRMREIRECLLPGPRAIRGLYAGGTLAHEAVLILTPLVGPVATNLMPGSAGRHRVTDLGADEFTVGRAHPMLDARLRAKAIQEAGRERDVAVLLLDVVLGYGAAPDPAGDLVPAITAARQAAHEAGRDLSVVASVVGTTQDPQGLHDQTARLAAAGAWVLPSNAQAARAAACIVGEASVRQALLGAGEC